MSNLQNKIDEAIEQARCAEMNLGNLASAVPGLVNHPFFKIVQLQLDTTIKVLLGEKADEFEPDDI